MGCGDGHVGAPSPRPGLRDLAGVLASFQRLLAAHGREVWPEIHAPLAMDIMDLGKGALWNQGQRYTLLSDIELSRASLLKANGFEGSCQSGSMLVDRRVLNVQSAF